MTGAEIISSKEAKRMYGRTRKRHYMGSFVEAGDYPTGEVDLHRIRHGTGCSWKVVGEAFGFPRAKLEPPTLIAKSGSLSRLPDQKVPEWPDMDAVKSQSPHFSVGDLRHSRH